MKDVFIRIDDRLLHGQVVVSWIPYLKTDKVIVADDEYARDDFMCELIKSSAPEKVLVDVKTIEETAKLLNKKNNGNKILILLRSIEGIKKLSEKFQLRTVNIGGLGAAEGRKRYYKSIHLSDYEIKILKELAADNIDVEIRMLPKDKPIEISGN